MIASNKVRCRVCKNTIESRDPVQYETCSCGAIAITGGNARLGRAVRSWSDLEELSELRLSWQNVLDCKFPFDKIDRAAQTARLAGYSFFVFNGEVWRVSSSSIMPTGKMSSDLSSSKDCLVKAQ